MSSDAIVDDAVQNRAATCNRPQLLVSVRNIEEATAALEGGADWIDLKEPLAGPLGAVDADLAKKIVDHVAGQRPVSAALGELIAWPGSPACRLLDIQGIEVVKLGLAGCAVQKDWQSKWESAAKAISQAGKHLVAVAYADWEQSQAPHPRDVIACSKAAGGRYLLIDTFDKQAGPVLLHLPDGKLEAVLRLARQASLATVVAGGLSRKSLFQLPEGCIDLVAVRGGVCIGSRTGHVDRESVAGFRNAISARWSV